MKQFNTIKTARTLAIAAMLFVAAVPAYAQSHNGAIGAVVASRMTIRIITGMAAQDNKVTSAITGNTTHAAVSFN